MLLSADPFYSAEMAAAGVELALGIEDVGGVETLRLTDRELGEVASVALNQISGEIRIIGSTYDDFLRVEFDPSKFLDYLPGGIIFAAGEGIDTMGGPETAVTWNITRHGAGDLNGFDFAEVENLLGNTRPDTFIYQSGGRLSGWIDGGIGLEPLPSQPVPGLSATSALDFDRRQIPSRDTLVGGDDGNLWSLDGLDRGTLNGAVFISIESLAGGSGSDTFEVLNGAGVSHGIHGGGGIDSLQGPSDATIWLITGSDAGRMGAVDFSEIENVRGGDGTDLFQIHAGGGISGILDGGQGENVLDYTPYDGPVQIRVLDEFQVETAGVRNMDEILGGPGIDTLLGPDDENNWIIEGKGSGAINGTGFRGIESLVGGAGSDLFAFSDGASFGGDIDGGAGSNTLYYGAYSVGVTVDLGTGEATGTGSATRIQRVYGGSGGDLLRGTAGTELLQGGGGDDLLVAGGAAWVAGDEGLDSLIGSDADRSWHITGQDLGTFGGTVFAAIENLIGGAGQDLFRFQGGRISGQVEGGGGSNTLDFSAEQAGVAVDLDVATTGLTGSFANIQTLLGGVGLDTLIGHALGSVWQLTGLDAGTVDGLAFSGIESLSGGTGKDSFIFIAAGALSGTLDGGGGEDEVDFSAAETAVAVHILASTQAMGTNGIRNVRRITGSSEEDVLIGGDGGQVWTITGADTGEVEGIRFAGFENLQGSAGDDLFAVAPGGSFNGTISGGGGLDTLSFASQADGVSVDLAAGSATGIASFQGIGKVLGGSGWDEMLGPAVDSLWTVNGPGAGSVGGLSFAGFEDLTGAAGNEDVFTLEPGGQVAGLIQGGDGGLDTLVLGEASYDSILYRPSGPQSGTIALDGVVMRYAGFEPITGPASGNVIVIDLTDITGAMATLKPNTITAATDDYTLTADDGGFESHDITFTGAGTSVTINLGVGNDTLTLMDLAGTTLDNKLIISGGAGNDTFKFMDNWGVGVTLKEAGGGGTDTLDFSMFSDDGDPIVIAPQVDGSIDIIGQDGPPLPAESSLTLDSADKEFESLTGANINLTGLVGMAKDELAGGIKEITDFMRDLAGEGAFLASLPLIGGSADVALSKALDFAEALDEIRLEIEDVLQGIGPITTDDLLERLNMVFGMVFGGAGRTLQHLGAAVLSPRALGNADIQWSDKYTFEFTVKNEGESSGTTYTLIVDVDASSTAMDTGSNEVTIGFGEPLNMGSLAGAITAGLNQLGLTGQVGVLIRKVGDGSIVGDSNPFMAMDQGRLVFQALGLDIKEFSLKGLGEAVDKLGLPSDTPISLPNVQEILRGLDGLDVSLAPGPGVTLDVSFDPMTGRPQLRLDVDYRAQRESGFSFDLGQEADMLGLGFDLEARLATVAELVFDFQLGLDLDAMASSFFLDIDELRAGLEITGSADDVGIDIGFLGASINAGGTFVLDAGLTAVPSGSPQTGITDLSTLASSLTLTPTSADGSGPADFQVSLTLAAESGLGGFAPSGTVSASGDPFAGKDIMLMVDASFTNSFKEFNNLTSAGVVSLLGQISGWLDSVREGELISGIDIPFIRGGLGEILDLAEILSDALLYDEGPDDVRDGGDKLVTDLNRALLAAGVGKFIRAQGNGNSIDLIAVDPDVDGFSIAKVNGEDTGGFGDMGFVYASAMPDGNFLKIAGGAANIMGRFGMGNNAVFNVTVTRPGKDPVMEKVKLLGGETASNTGIGDDIAKLLDGENVATFDTAQELVQRLNQIITLGSISYDDTGNILRYEISFTNKELFSIELPTEFELDLSPVANFQSDTRLIIDARGGLHFTLGLDLNEIPAGASLLTNDTALDTLFDVDDLTKVIKRDEAAQAPGNPREVVGALSGNASFGVSLGTIEGTSSGGSSTSTRLHDPAATFQTDGVKVGDFVRNRTENITVQVTNVVSEIQLDTDPVGNWNGDSYLVTATVTIPALFGRPKAGASNINVTKQMQDQTEVAIAVNPVDADNIIVAPINRSLADGIFATPSEENVWVTTNGGMNWTKKVIPFPAGTTASQGDPTIVFSRDGSRVVYMHLANKMGGADESAIAFAVSTDKGQNWNMADTGVVGSTDLDETGDGSIDDNDKEWIAVGPDVNNLAQDRFLVTWVRSNVVFAATSLDGINWSTPVKVSDDPGKNPSGDAIDPIPGVAPNGDLYIIWEDIGTTGVAEIRMDLSKDGGITWGRRNETVFFEFDSSDLTPEAMTKLNAYAVFLQNNPSLNVHLIGHTDDVGTEMVNQNLSVSRANAVRTHLIGQGIAAARLTAAGAGELNPIATNKTGAGRELNRRVELRIDSDQVIYTGNVNRFDDPASGGIYVIPAQPTRGVWLGLSMDIDLSGGPHNGRIYVSFADQGDLDGNPDQFNATDHDNLDIFLIASDDGGETWIRPDNEMEIGGGIEPQRINTDHDSGGTNSQFLSWMDVDQTTGNLAMFWLDARDDDGLMGPGDTNGIPNDDVQVYGSYSLNGGQTWEPNFIVSDGPSSGPSATSFQFGEYNGLAFHANTIHMAWSDNSNSTGDNPGPAGNNDTYYERIRLTNRTFLDLLNDINAAIAEVPALAGKLLAVESAPGSKTLKLEVIDPRVVEFILVTQSTDPAFRDLGIQTLTERVRMNPGDPLAITAGKKAPTQVGQLTADQSFRLQLPDLGVDQLVTVAASQTVNPANPSFNNRSILDLSSDVEMAVNTALMGTSAQGLIEVSEEGGKLLFSRLGASTPGMSDDFTVMPASPGSADELGITSAVTSDEADLVLTLTHPAGMPPLPSQIHRVSLDGATTIGQVIEKIVQQTGGSGTIMGGLTFGDVRVELTPDDPSTAVNEAGTGLTLTDLTAGPMPDGNFMVAAANGSLAGIRLAITNTDKNPLDPMDTPDAMIRGGSIGGASVLDRLFIEGNPSLGNIANAEIEILAGVVVEDIEIVEIVSGGTVITSNSFEFSSAKHYGKVIAIKGVNGFTPGDYTISNINETANTAKLSGVVGTNGQVGGVGTLKTGVSASATFGFVGLELTGDAGLGGDFSLGFNTGPMSPGADGKLTLKELLDNLDEPLDLLAPPDLSPISPAMDFGNLMLTVGLKAGGSDFTDFATTLLGGGTPPQLGIVLVSPGDPFIQTRFEQAAYAKTSATTFTLQGDFRDKLLNQGNPSGTKIELRFTDTSDPMNEVVTDVKVTSAMFASGQTTVTVEPPAMSPFALPADISASTIDVVLLPAIDVDTSSLDGISLGNFDDISFAQILAALKALVNFLSDFDELAFLEKKIPLIDKSVTDLLSFAQDFAMAIDEVENNPAGTLQILEDKINQAIGLAAPDLQDLFTELQDGAMDPVLGLDPMMAPLTDLIDDVLDLSLVGSDILKFDLVVGGGFSEGLNVSLPQIDFGSTLSSLGLGRFLDLSGSAGLEASGSILLRLQVGIDLTNPTDIYLFDQTGLEANLEVGGSDLAFRIGVGPFSLSIGNTDMETSSLSLAGKATAGISMSSFDGDGKVLLQDAELDADLTGTAMGTLPVFFPTDARNIGAIRIGEDAGMGLGNLANILNPKIKTQDMEPVSSSQFVIDVSDVIEGLDPANFNFDAFSLFDNILLAVDGLDSFLGLIGDLIGGRLGDSSLPLVGDDLARGAGFIDELREDVIVPLRDALETAKDAGRDFTDADKNLISKALFDLLGPPGLNLLQPLDGVLGPDDNSPGDFIALDADKLADYLLDPDTLPEETQMNQTEILWEMKLGSKIAALSTDIGFDLGIPGLGLETEGEITLDLEWALDLGFGISFMDGFFLLVDDPNELLFDINVTLPASVRGTLGFLGLKATDKPITVGGEERHTGLGATFSLDISEDGATGADAQRLSFTELGNIDFDFEIAASAAATLGLELGLSADLFSEIFGPGAADVIAGFPTIKSDFIFLWELGMRPDRMPMESLQQYVDNNPASLQFTGLNDVNFNSLKEGLEVVAFQDIALDLGSFMSEVLGPMVNEVARYTEPIQPLLTFITSEIPIIGQLGLSITWLDLAKAFGGDKFNAELFRSIAEVITLISNIASISTETDVMLPIGDMTIYDEEGVTGFQSTLFDPTAPNLGMGGGGMGGAFDALKGEGLIGDVFGMGFDLDSINLDTIEDALGGLPGGGMTASTLNSVVKQESAGGFAFPFLEDPGQIFGLLLGQNADLVTYDLGALVLGFEFSQFFTIFGPLGVSIGLMVEFMADTAFGYDTEGIRKFIESDFQNPELLFDGFFISDSPKLNGVDDPELTFLTELFAAAELNLGIARAGIEAALGFKILFDLFDPDDDGKVRFREMLSNIENQLRAPGGGPALAPLAIFDVRGEIFALLSAFLEISFGFFTFRREFPIFGPVTLFDFEIDFFRPPLLATEVGINGDLIINTGKFAEQRMLGNASDLSEHIIIESDGTDGDFVKVKVKGGPMGDSLGDDSTEFLEYKVRRGSKIIIDGGEGNDNFDLSNFTANGVLFDIDGGAGNDVITLNPIMAQGVNGKFHLLQGGGGDDMITGSGGSDRIIGGTGNDILIGGGGDDLILGDEGEFSNGMLRSPVKPTDGKDMLQGGMGRDILIGGGGKDNILGDEHPDLILTGGGLLTFISSGAFKSFDNVKPLAEDGIKETENLAFDTTAGDTANGGSGEDLIFGSAGPDKLIGGPDKDIIFGQSGFDSIDGGAGNDVLFGDRGRLAGIGTSGRSSGVSSSSTTLHDPDASFITDRVMAGDFVRNIEEGVFARVTKVVSDFELETQMVGNWSGDAYVLFRPESNGGGNADNILGGAGDDLIFGGDGGDTIYGDGGRDEIMGGSGPDKIFGGPDGDVIFGQGEPDQIFGQGGKDALDGGAGSDEVFGGDESDLINGDKGSDILDGEAGGDTYLTKFQGGTNTLLTRVLDTGNSDDGTDRIIAQGTVFDDIILLRANTDGSVAFMALINSEFHVERINYTNAVERVVVNGSFGDDFMAVDDAVSEITLNGEFGNDAFQVGQLFRSDRADINDIIPPGGDGFSDVTGIALDDIFATIETTRGFLSNGISAPMTINGGLGEDNFVVFHNKAILNLNGDGGDDVFEIRAFALAGSQEPQRERTDITGGQGADLVQYAVNAPVNLNGGDGFDILVIIGTEFGDDFVVTEDGVFGAGLSVNFINIESLRLDGAEGDDRFFVKSTKETFITELLGGLGSDTFNMSGDTPPIVSNDLRGHSGIILQSVESTDPRLDEQAILGVSVNVADNEEPFVVITPTGGSTIITETDKAYDDPTAIVEKDTVVDSYRVVLTRRPTRTILIKALAPIPTPDQRELRRLAFRLSSPSLDPLLPDAEKAKVEADGSALILKFTQSNWYLPQTVHILADAKELEDQGPLFTRPELGDDNDELTPEVPFSMNDTSFEGLHFGMVNHLVAADSQQEGALLEVINGSNDPTMPMPTMVKITDDASVTMEELIGRKLQITRNPGAGQSRFILEADNVSEAGKWILLLDRPFVAADQPDDTSRFEIKIDDAIVGKVSAIDEEPMGLPPLETEGKDERSTFTDSTASFPTAGEGLRGAILEIIGGPGAGQQRLILNNDPADPTHQLILNGPWRKDPVAGESLYRIKQYNGLAIQSVEVQIHDDDRPGLVIDEERSFEDDGDMMDEPLDDRVDDLDTVTAVIEGGDGDHRGEKDLILVRLSQDPGMTPVEVRLKFDPAQLQLKDLSTGNLLDEMTPLMFDIGNWDTFQPVLVTALTDMLREGAHTDLVEFEVVAGSSDVITSPMPMGMPGPERFMTIPETKPVFFVGLSQRPLAGSVSVSLNNVMLQEAVFMDGVPIGDFLVADNKVVFLDGTGDFMEVFGEIEVDYQYTAPGFLSAFIRPVLARISDADAPTVLLRETGGSTDVMEVRFGSLDPAHPENIPILTFGQPWHDEYELVLTGQPEIPMGGMAGDGTVTVTVAPEITKTTRTGGIRHDNVQVRLSSSDPRSVEEELDVTDIEILSEDGTHTVITSSSFQFLRRHTEATVRLHLSGAGGVLPGSYILTQVDVDANEATIERLGGGVAGMAGDTGGEGVLETGNLKITFTDQDWDDPVRIRVFAVDDGRVDGSDTKEFAPGPNTVSGILGPVVVEGAGGRGSLSLQAPLLLPGETNRREPDGFVQSFTANPGGGFGAMETMRVLTADLEMKRIELELDTIQDFIGRTVEIASGNGLDVVLDPERPDLLYDRFWLIHDIQDIGGGESELTLQNPSMVDVSQLGPMDVPDAMTEYALTGLSENFFVDEKTRIDYMFVHDEDSPADHHGVLTASRLSGLNMGPDLVFAGQMRPGGITFGDLEVLEINLGTGNNTLDVKGTPIREDGFQTWTFINTGNDIEWQGVQGDTVNVSINGADQTFLGNVVSSVNAGSSPLQVETLTTIDQVIPGPANSLSGAVISILAPGTGSPDAVGQTRRILYNSGNQLTIDRPWEFDPTGTEYEIVNQRDGALAINTEGGDDTVDASAATGDITVFGGTGVDALIGGAGDDVIFGDRGKVDYYDEDGKIVTRLGLIRDDTLGNGESILGFVSSAQPSTLVDNQKTFPTADGGLAGLMVSIINGKGAANTLHPRAQLRRIVSNTEHELILNEPWEEGRVPDTTSEYRISFIPEDQTDAIVRDAGFLVSTHFTDDFGDNIFGGGGEDIVIGGGGGDNAEGGLGKDLVFGDHVKLDRRVMVDGELLVDDDFSSPRFRALAGTLIYDADGADQVDDGTDYEDPTGVPVWANWEIDISEPERFNSFGDDYLAGGDDDDMIFGQQGDDTIQGDGSVQSKVDGVTTYGASRNTPLMLEPSFNAATDGDDYIEGNGGSDVIFGNLGQDDIIGGSSDLFSLTTLAQRADGADILFGGSGTHVDRNNPGDLPGVAPPDRHGRDADMLLGDNGRIFRLVGTNSVGGGALLTFNYDAAGNVRIVPRAADLLDYTPGGPDHDTDAENDIGAADEIHGGPGGDALYGMAGDDLLFGDGDDDDIIGGWGNDWISGGAGQDGVLGDDGRIATSRNTQGDPSELSEPLHGIAKLAQVDLRIDTPGDGQVAFINLNGALRKTANLTPYNLDPDLNGQDPHFDPEFAADIIFGGLGDDFLHGGAGDDAISGAEALQVFFDEPENPGDILHFNESRGEFAGYDENEPLRKLFVNANGEPDDMGTPFILNFLASEGPVVGQLNGQDIHSDGQDAVFGDLGNDWLVGGTGRDNLYGGWGSDLLNADDDHDSTAGSADPLANDVPDGPQASYEDRAYGGAGRDYIIGNTGGDRLIDWVGEFNSYLLPFAPFGSPVVSRTLQPQLMEFLYDLSENDGADPTRSADTGSDPERNGEPEGELGLVLQKDADWKEQTGAPDDPQAGNIPGGERDVVRSADFNNQQADGFAPDSGIWTIANGRFQVQPDAFGGDAVSVFYLDKYLPGYFELEATINADKVGSSASGGLANAANAYLIFDYQSETNFKFAGINVKSDKLEMGRRTVEGWIVDEQRNMQLKPNTDYHMLLSLNGTAATLVVDNQIFKSHVFAPRIDADGFAYGLNRGMVGIGANNAVGRIDNVAVKVLRPGTTLEETEDFSASQAGRFNAIQGAWQINGERLETVAGAGQEAFMAIDLGLEGNGLWVSSRLDLDATLRTDGVGGFIFDRYDAETFKFIALSALTDEVIVGHHNKRRGLVVDGSASWDVDPLVDAELSVTLRGLSASIEVDGNLVLGHVFNAPLVDGTFGLLARDGLASFDTVTFSTDDPAFLDQEGGAFQETSSLDVSGGLDNLAGSTLSSDSQTGDLDMTGSALPADLLYQPERDVIVSWMEDQDDDEDGKDVLGGLSAPSGATRGLLRELSGWGALDGRRADASGTGLLPTDDWVLEGS